MASIVIFAVWPIFTSGCRSRRPRPRPRSPTCRPPVSSTVPALFMVPTTAVSPSSMLRRVTMPSIGDFDAHLAQVGLGVLERRRLLLASACCCVRTFCSCGAQVLLADARARSRRARTARAWSGRPSTAPAGACRLSCASLSCACVELSSASLSCSALRLRRAERRLAARHAGAQVARVDLQQELALLDAVAFVDRQLGHAARSCRR